jgi:alpha-glucosidase
MSLISLPTFLNICPWTSLLFLWPTCNQLIDFNDAGSTMAGRAALAVASLLCASITSVLAQTSTTSYRAIFTVPASAQNGLPVLPNINDPQAVNAQDVCPGYTASNVVRTPYGLTASLQLAGKACNVYGTDVDSLNLTVEYQSSDRLHVEIVPTYVDSSNSSWYILPEALVQKPTIDADADAVLDSDLNFVWSNDPTFSFSVIRQSTGDVLFSSTGYKLVFENQFIEFGSSLPENYNLYGMGEVIHGLRMGNNITRTFYAADVGDPIDYNIYGDHSFYLDTRYYEVDATTGNLTYAANATNESAEYVSYSHGVYMRNSHGQEVLLRPSNMTWRTIGGSIDLYFYAGPTQDKVTKAYQTSAIGLPAMQQYFTFGYHQCRWGYTNWTELQDVVDNFAKFGIPLENIW